MDRMGWVGTPMSCTSVSQEEPNISAIPRAVRSKNSKASSLDYTSLVFANRILVDLMSAQSDLRTALWQPGNSRQVLL